MQNIKKTIVTVVLAMIIIGVIIIAQNAFKKNRIENWASVEGTVLYSTIRIKPKGLNEHYLPSIGYAYTVNGEKYKKSVDNSLNSGYLHKEDVQKIIDKYPEGSTVTVYYNPENPSKSILADL